MMQLERLRNAIWGVEKAMQALVGGRKEAGRRCVCHVDKNETSNDKNTPTTPKKVSNKPSTLSADIGKEKDETEERLEYITQVSSIRDKVMLVLVRKWHQSLSKGNNLLSHKGLWSKLYDVRT